METCDPPLTTPKGGDVYDRATRPPQVGDGVLGGEDHASQVDAENEIDVVDRGLRQRDALGRIYPGVRDDRIDQPEALRRAVYESLHLLRVLDVGLLEPARAAQLVDRLGRFRTAVSAAAEDRDIGALPGKRESGGVSDARGRAGD